MSWFRVDDRFHSHPKVVALPLDALGLWTRCGSYCAQHPRLSGVVSLEMATMFAGSKSRARALVGKLVAAGLWIECEGGWRFHDWLDFQLTPEEDEERRLKRAAAGKAGGVRSGEQRRSKAEANAKQSASIEAKQNPTLLTRSGSLNPPLPPEGVMASPVGAVDGPEPAPARFGSHGLDGAESAVWARGITRATGRPCTQPSWADGARIAKVLQSHATGLQGAALEQWLEDSAYAFAKAVDARFGGLKVRRWEDWENSGRPGYEPESGVIEILRVDDDSDLPPPQTEADRLAVLELAKAHGYL
jgi:hypothetical protein